MPHTTRKSRLLFAATMAAVTLSSAAPWALTRTTAVDVDLIDALRGLLLGAGIALCWLYFRARRSPLQ